MPKEIDAMQDGGDFYITAAGIRRYVSYFKRVHDYDMIGARAARHWFLTEFCRLEYPGATVVWNRD